LKEANEIAVMIDTFKPLEMTSSADNIDDKEYALSWMDK
jgi:homogentisate 1,2-dioxygenase